MSIRTLIYLHVWYSENKLAFCHEQGARRIRSEREVTEGPGPGLNMVDKVCPSQVKV